MGMGSLNLQIVSADGAILIEGAQVILTDESGRVVHDVVTDSTGHAPIMFLEAPAKELMEEPNTSQRRYSLYNAQISAPNYRTKIVSGIMIFDTVTSTLEIHMYPLAEGESPQAREFLNIGGHALDDPQVPEPQEEPIPPRILPEVIIPNTITVHLGRPADPAPNVRVSFIEYIKNVTSHEIFDTWPEQTIIANVWCIVSLTLNRVFTEFYRKQGRAFDITSSTTIDQKYVHGGVIGTRISAIVDRVFNQFLAVIGHKEPFLALYNDGVVANFPGRLSQWGSFFDARDRGMNAWEIIRNYYAQNLELRVCDNFSGPLESWPGGNLAVGSTGIYVRTMQRYLNRILGRHTDVIINPVDGVFGNSTRNSVLLFQQIYNLPRTGVIDRATWYQISRLYAIEKALWELYSEGIRIGVGQTPPTQIIREGSTGPLVTELQFLLDFIGMFYSEIPFVAGTSRFDRLTTEAVLEFQRHFGISPDGVVGPATWAALYNVYWGIVNNAEPPVDTPPEPDPPFMPPFPGVNLRMGMSGPSVRQVQVAINRLAEAIPGLWRIPEDGAFGAQTRDAIFSFQRIFGLNIDGVVGPITWNRLFREYLDLQPGGEPAPPAIPPYPGSPIRQGSRGEDVRLIQQTINTLAPCYPGRLWRLNADGADVIIGL